MTAYVAKKGVTNKGYRVPSPPYTGTLAQKEITGVRVSELTGESVLYRSTVSSSSIESGLLLPAGRWSSFMNAGRLDYSLNR